MRFLVTPTLPLLGREKSKEGPYAARCAAYGPSFDLLPFTRSKERVGGGLSGGITAATNS